MTTVMQALRFINILAAGVNAGGILLILMAVVPTVRSLPPSIGLRLHRAVNPRGDRYLPITVVMSGLAAVAILIVHYQLSTTAVVFTIIGLIGTFGVFFTSVFFDVPLSRTMHSWSTDSVPSEYAAALARWDRIHTLRTASACLALICYLIAGLNR
jgi:uncharacterized membrane protein